MTQEQIEKLADKYVTGLLGKDCDKESDDYRGHFAHALAFYELVEKSRPPAPVEGEGEKQLRQLFKNSSDCYADTWSQDGLYGPMVEGDVIQAMTEHKFVEVVSSLFTGSHWRGEVDYPNNYVCGFLFDKQVQQVVLIWKEKPAWQKGKLNGVGGKIEPGETPYQAMVREFKEETGLTVNNWKSLCAVNGNDWRVHFFYSVDEENQFEYAETKETEEVAKIDVGDFMSGNYSHIPNLAWLIPMAVARIKSPGDNIVTGSRWQQGLTFPTREEAEQWAKSDSKHVWFEEECLAALAMYDWIMSKTNLK